MTNSTGRDGGPLRVLHVIARMNVGGPALQITGLAAGLDPSRFEQRLLTGSVGSGEADYITLRTSGLAHEVIHGLGRAPRARDDAAALARLHRQIREFRPHIVHTHAAKAGLLGRVAARAAGVPGIVHTFHGHLLHGYFSPAATRAVVAAERTLARVSTRLVAVGAQVRDDLLDARVGRAHQYVVIPPGVSLVPMPERATARELLGLPADALVIVLVARLTKIKRPERFVEVARRLADRYPDAVFVIAGEGDLLPDLRSRAGSNVRFLGWRADVETVYAASDLAVLTSDNEGMPVSLIEAGMCGLPAVATRVGSVGEVVLDGRTGWLCDPSGGALLEAVDGALADVPGLRAAGAAARDYTSTTFSTGQLVAAHEQLYLDVAAGTAR